MRVTDIIRGILDLLDQANQRELDVLAPPDTVSSDQDHAMIQMRRMAGIMEPHAAGPAYTNSPDAQTQPVAAVIASGTDVHHSKNPADIRTNAASMYPAHQHDPREQ